MGQENLQMKNLVKSLAVILPLVTTSPARSQGYFDTSTGSFKCTNGMPEFTGGKPTGYTNKEARVACSCIKSRFVKTGWELDVYEKVMNGDTSDWRTGAMMSRLKSAVQTCSSRYRL